MPRRELTKIEAVRRALRPGWAPTLRELQPKVEARLKRIIGRQDLYTILAGMEQTGEIGIVGRAETRRYVLICPAGRP